MVVANPAKLEEYWAENLRADNALLKNSPVHQLSATERSKVVPLSLHGDGVSVTGLGKVWQQGVEACSLQSVAQRSSTRRACFLLSLLPHAQLTEQPGLLDNFWKCLAWSLHYAFLGVWPTCDPCGRHWPRGTRHAQRAGKPLAAGHRAVVTLLKGDLDYFLKSLALPFATSLEPCSLCSCNSSDRHWTDFNPSNDWLQNMEPKASTCPLFSRSYLSTWQVAPLKTLKTLKP